MDNPGKFKGYEPEPFEGPMDEATRASEQAWKIKSPSFGTSSRAGEASPIGNTSEQGSVADTPPTVSSEMPNTTTTTPDYLTTTTTTIPTTERSTTSTQPPSTTTTVPPMPNPHVPGPSIS